mmetsp:Transcript_13033/g.25253  ORF Transcript_13033/g.25253 Transcript_13033/m.25253 type:complete len:384 (+) Transcript_13033:229-1380(+)|eukprot:6072077-Pleurochrysis_carterae.AAC.1
MPADSPLSNSCVPFSPRITAFRPSVCTFLLGSVSLLVPAYFLFKRMRTQRVRSEAEAGNRGSQNGLKDKQPHAALGIVRKPGHTETNCETKSGANAQTCSGSGTSATHRFSAGNATSGTQHVEVASVSVQTHAAASEKDDVARDPAGMTSRNTSARKNQRGASTDLKKSHTLPQPASLNQRSAESNEKSHQLTRAQFKARLKNLPISADQYLARDGILRNCDQRAFHAAGAILWKVTPDNRIITLMIREERNGRARLNFIGGKREPDEHRAEDTAARECSEETGERLSPSTVRSMKNGMAPVMWFPYSKYCLFMMRVENADHIEEGAVYFGTKTLHWVDAKYLLDRKWSKMNLHPFADLMCNGVLRNALRHLVAERGVSREQR